MSNIKFKISDAGSALVARSHSESSGVINAIAFGSENHDANGSEIALKKELVNGGLAPINAGMLAFSHLDTNPDGSIGGKIKAVVSPKDAPFYAAFDGVTIDNAAIEAAAIEATGKVLAIASGTALVQRSTALEDGEPASYALDMQSGHVIGQGGEILAKGTQNYAIMRYKNKSGVFLSNVTLRATATAGNDAQAGVLFYSDTGPVKDVVMAFSHIKNTSWGALASAQVSTGQFWGVRWVGNYVTTEIGNNADGLHMAGAIHDSVSGLNVVNGRDDAGFALNMLLGQNGRNNLLTSGIATDCLVGVDFSGTQWSMATGMVLNNTRPHTASNPAMRAITYTGDFTPKNFIFSNSFAFTNAAESGKFDVKVDASKSDGNTADVNGFIHGLMTKRIYIDALNVTVTGNLLIDDAQIFLAPKAGNIFIGTNTFQGKFDILGQANPGLGGAVMLAKQNWNKLVHENFLPNYSEANPFWVSKVKLDADVRTIVNSASTYTTPQGMDVANSIFVINTPCIVDDILAIADCSTHIGLISICTLDDIELVRAEFQVESGVGGENVKATLIFPSRAGNAYKAKLAAGTYKLRAASVLNQMTLKSVALAIWS